MREFDAGRIELFLSAFKSWAHTSRRVKGIALVGSWSKEERDHAEADADVVLVVDEPAFFRTHSDWMSEIDWGAAGLSEGRWSECDSAAACSRHFTFGDGAEVEVSFVGEDWASVDPIDPAVRRIAGNGMRVVHDPSGLLNRLLATL